MRIKDSQFTEIKKKISPKKKISKIRNNYIFLFIKGKINYEKYIVLPSKNRKIEYDKKIKTNTK